MIYYAGAENYGQKWQKYTWVQVLGFVLLVLGTMIYNQVFKLPKFYYPEKETPNFETSNNQVN